MFRSISLQSKLIAFMSLVTVALTGSILVFHAMNLQQSVRQTFIGQLTGITTAINGRYEESRSIQDVQQIFDYIQLRNSKVRILTLHGTDDMILASTDRTLIGKSSPNYLQKSIEMSKALVDQQLWTSDEPAIRLMAPLLEDGMAVGVVELVLNAREEKELIRQQIDTAILYAIISSVVFLLILWIILQKLLVTPLHRLRQAAIAIKLGERTRKIAMNASSELNEVADAFNDMVVNLDARYSELQQTLLTLQSTQEQLVQSEKMSALGKLVAGVAHEINTPVGIGVTAVSYLDQRTKDFAELYGQSRMKKSDLESYLKSAQESTAIIQSNLQRASELIKSFKQVSIDQSNEVKRTFNLHEYINDIVRSLQPTIKKTRQRISVLGERDLQITSYPGPISQIVTNLVMNSLVHAYDPNDEGDIVLRIERQSESLVFQYADDGKGMAKETADNIFEPFFTTNRSRGGTGLGMNIVYNLVTQQFGGTIQCFSTPGKGTTFIIEIPFKQEETPNESQSA